MEKRFALIGHPVAGSLSPALFAAAYGGRFAYDLIDEEDFDRAWERAVAGYDGFNVTAPFKRRVVERLGESGKAWLSPEVVSTGCANTLVRDGGLWRAYNTDVDGVRGALEEGGGDSFASLGMTMGRQLIEGPVLQQSFGMPDRRQFPAGPGCTALIIGDGGAARAAVEALRDSCQVRVAARSDGSLYQPLPLADLVIYTLPGSAPVPEGLPLEGAVVLEAEYRSPHLAGQRCRRYISGRRWLLHQGLAAYRLFTGMEPDRAAMEAVLAAR